MLIFANNDQCNTNQYVVGDFRAIGGFRSLPCVFRTIPNPHSGIIPNPDSGANRTPIPGPFRTLLGRKSEQGVGMIPERIFKMP
jgi:hypothetical protein